MTPEEQIISARQYALEVKKTLDLIAYEDIASVAQLLCSMSDFDGDCYLEGLVLIAGNGGSAATASHFANDLTKMAVQPAISLPDLTSTATAFGNDVSWNRMYAELAGYYASPGGLDVHFGISCSGASPNIVEFLGSCEHPSRAVLLTGPSPPEEVLELVDHVIRVPHEDIRIQEDVHLMLCHILAGMIPVAT